MNDKRCTGCGACLNICPHDAIEMNIDEEGFCYPFKDMEKCTECGLCEKVCHIENKEKKDEFTVRSAYALKSSSDETRINSTSGGAFTELAKVILKRDGYVVGAKYNEDWTVEHMMADDKEGFEKIRTSKYQQSNIGFIHRDIKEKLEEGKEVLFVGTPCQIGGLRRFLGKEYKNLILCDFICLGVPSPKLFQKYLEQLNKKYTSKITNIRMKSKKVGWHDLTTVVSFENGDEYVKSGGIDSYVRFMIVHHTGLRESCFNCQFKGGNSEADISIGDFWGMENDAFDDNLGVSVVMCKTSKGEALVEEIKKNCIWIEKDIEDIVKGNIHLVNSVKRGKISNNKLFYMIDKYGYFEAFKMLEEQMKEG